MTTLITAARLFDSLAEEVVADGAVVVDGNRIVAAGPRRNLSVPRDAGRIELGDRTLMPGLIDAHLHLVGVRSYGELTVPSERDLRTVRAVEDCRRLLRAGFTTVRDCGSMVALGLRRAIEEGTLEGPTIYAAGPMICQTGGHGDVHVLPAEWVCEVHFGRLVDSPWEGRKAVREAIRAGAHLVKICTTGGIGSIGDHPEDSHFTAEEIAAIVDEAHRGRRLVASHSQGRDGIVAAVRGGVDSIEHGYHLDAETAAEMAARGTALVPTHALARVFERSLTQPDDMPPWRLEKQKQVLSAMRASVRVALEAGLLIGAGSDYFGVPGRAHGDNADEAIALVEAGMSPVRALRALTLDNARIIGCQSECGSLETGKSADLVACAGDPAVDVRCLKSVDFVMRQGKIARSDGDAGRNLEQEGLCRA